jgi:zinc finger SWIM domain-containing protein 3
MAALQQFNEGTIVEWNVEPTTTLNEVKFNYIFWTFRPAIEGFVHCLPVVCIDGTHLNGKYKGKLLTAVGITGNNQVFPLAFAIVDDETVGSWSWFLRHLSTHVVKGRPETCVISDRHIGIIRAI